jgi:histone acetyltransferase (RNA polymerase elongator complex component)
MSNRQFIIPIFIPHKGCPNDCVFCNQRKITGQAAIYDYKRIDGEISAALRTIDLNKKPIVEIAFYGGSFTAIDSKSQEVLLSMAKEYVDQYQLQGIRISTRPDYINDVILNRLKKYGVKIIELGVQSLNESVLEASNRGHETDIVYKSAQLIKDYGFTLGIQLMIGLPGDNGKSSLETVRKVIDIRPDISRIYPTLVIKDTVLEKMYNQGIYSPLSLNEAIELSKNMYHMLFTNDIQVIRIGLQPTKNILEGEDVIAGPFHPSFRSLVISSYIYDLIVEAIDEFKGDTITFELNNKDISYLVGDRKSNKIRIIEKYNLKKFKIVTNSEIQRGKIIVKLENEIKEIRFS